MTRSDKSSFVSHGSTSYIDFQVVFFGGFLYIQIYILNEENYDLLS